MSKPSAPRSKRPLTIQNRATGAAVSQSKIVRTNNRWRDQYNPLRALVISRLVTMLEAAERGEHAEFQWLCRFIEKRFPVLRSLIARRRASLLKLDWDIKVRSKLPAGITPAMAAAQQAHLRSYYERITNLKDAIKQLALAEFRGFTILQKHYGPDGCCNEFHWLPQWNWVRDGQFGPWYWNQDAQQTSHSTLGGENSISTLGMPRTDFIIREESSPINEIAAIAFVNSSMAKKDWVAFVEMFGLPGCVIEMPPDIPSGKEDEYQAAAERVAEASSGAVPAGAKPSFPTAQIRGSAPFKEFLDAEKEDVVLAGTGGKLSMLNEATGIGGSQGKEQADAFDDIAQGEAGEISEVFQKDCDILELARKFPGQPAVAYFQLAAEDEEDANSLTQRVLALSQAGLVADAQEISEKLALKLTRPAVVAAPGEPATAVPAIQNRQSQLAQAFAADLQPLRSRLAAVLTITDPDLQKQKLQKLLADMEQIKRNTLADPESAREIESIIATTLTQSLQSK